MRVKYVEYNRNSLYEDVWKEPLPKVAEKYGVPSTAIRKHCAELEIPFPLVGYWSQIKFGKSVRRPKLPMFNGPETVKCRYYIKDSENFSNALSNFLLELSCDETKDGFFEYCTQLRVPTELIKPHKLSQNASILNLDRRSKSEGKLYLPVSNEQFNRTVIFLDTLFKVVEYWGASVTRNSVGNIEIEVEDEKIEVFIKEKTRRIEHIKTEEELKAERKGRYVWVPRYDFLLTGELIFTIDSYQIPRQNWNDTSKKKIESDFGSIILSIFMAANSKKKLKEKREIEAERRRVELETRLKLEQLRQIEKERVSELEENAKDYKNAELIREFIDELQNMVQFVTNNVEKEKIEEYIIWAKAKADWLDPLTAASDEVLGCKHEKWLINIVDVGIGSKL